jgi:hypothetical protein
MVGLINYPDLGPSHRVKRDGKLWSKCPHPNCPWESQLAGDYGRHILSIGKGYKDPHNRNRSQIDHTNGWRCYACYAPHGAHGAAHLFPRKDALKRHWLGHTPEHKMEHEKVVKELNTTSRKKAIEKAEELGHPIRGDGKRRNMWLAGEVLYED